MEQPRHSLSGALKRSTNVGSAINCIFQENHMTIKQLGLRARLPESKIHRIINNKVDSPKIEDLIRIILSFQLTPDEADYFLALAHRALRPKGVDALDDAFRDIIEIYSNCKITDSNESWLTKANAELENRNLKWPSDKDLADGTTAKKDMV